MVELGKLHERDALCLKKKPESMIGKLIGKDDVGKYYVVGKDDFSSRIVTQEEFQHIPLAEIGGWWEISEFDITFTK
jgi:hypothetical protein